ncbi:hypothetical protein SLEP1_g50455 [Rubroshorea leprosula]|uniref:Uncharacterized protein n=1 Tax=Rubroshorea leprosula TaxID=152421 RepID=A0AAV5M3H0_9ROSI|nr:hypothetical protein SLEP1_g50455 [Rubroshorea leprosula]
MASFQALQVTLVARAPLTTNPLIEGNALMAYLSIATSPLTFGKEPMSSSPPNLIIGASRTKSLVLSASVTQVVKSITKDEDKAIKVKVQLMEETLKSIQGVQTNKPVDISSLCFFPNIQLPHKFKLPEFDKYNDTSCPYAHLTMYHRKMDPYASDNKLVIHYFQDSLIGPADACFSTLDKKKKSNESFKEFAQIWRGMVARVQPPLTNHELKQVEDEIKLGVILDYQAIKDILEQHQNCKLLELDNPTNTKIVNRKIFNQMVALGELTPIPANKPPNP